MSDHPPENVADQYQLPSDPDGNVRRGGWTRREVLSTVAFAVTAVCVVLLNVGLQQTVGSVVAAFDAEAHTRRVIESPHVLHSDLKDVESSARSFAISGKQSHLEPYYLATKAAAQHLEDLKKVTANNPRLLEQVQQLDPAVGRHLYVMKEMVDLGSKHVFRAVGQTALTDQGHLAMNEIRGRITEMLDAQRQQLSTQEQAVAARAWELECMVFTAGLLVVIVGVVLAVGLHRAVFARRRTEAEVPGLSEAAPS
jgi:CHASE3 domain sensor protein